MIYDCVIVGGGAAGCFALANLLSEKPHAKVLLLEKSNKLLSKVLVSGGGRCNVTHRFENIADFASNYPRGEKFMRKILHHFSPLDTIAWFESRNVKLKTEADGRLFPVSDSSSDVVNCLLAACQKAEMRLQVDLIKAENINNIWVLTTAYGTSIQCNNLIMATGGNSIKHLSKIFDNYTFEIKPEAPSLFSFNLKPHTLIDLMGVSLKIIRVKVAGSKLIGEGPTVITHWGLSGPAILRLSAFGAYEFFERNYQFKLLVNWLPDFNEIEVMTTLENFQLENKQKMLQSRPFLELPERLWIKLLVMASLDAKQTWSAIGKGNLRKLTEILCASAFDVSGKTTFKEEFVTGGGIETTEIHHLTCESKKYPGLYFAGEMLNTDGVTGGFNFQHAWSTGYLAAKAIAEKL